jgi:hypothetical protein
MHDVPRHRAKRYKRIAQKINPGRSRVYARVPQEEDLGSGPPFARYHS